MDLHLTGRTALVTGASTGIGRATALLLATEGARVIAAARSRATLESLAAEIQAANAPTPILLTADFATPTAPTQLAAQALQQAGQIDILVNNAGGSRPLTRPDDAETWQESFRLNFEAARLLSEALIPPMRDRGWGRIVNLTGALIAKSFNAAGPAKAALESWSKAAAATYAPYGITVNCVAPGRINSPQILDKLHPTDQSRQDYIDRNIPAARFGTPEEAAALIAFLASAPASYITGTTIPVDGGAMRLAF